MATAAKPPAKAKAKATKETVKAPAQPKEAATIPEEPKKRGRPSTFDQEIANEICARLSKGEPLAHICRDEHMPAVRTVSDWKTAHATFSADFAGARDEGYDCLAAQCLDIADDASDDVVFGENGPRANTEFIQRSKLRIETRLKLLAKWDPKRYGEKLDLNHGGQENNPVQVKTKVVMVPMKQTAETNVRPLEQDGG